jgi:hypothetical protein
MEKTMKKTIKGHGPGYKKSWMGGLIVLLFFCSVHNVTAQETNSWQHELTIYGWYSGIDGTVQFPGPVGVDSDFTVDASDIIENLSMIFMGGWASKKDRWSILADVVYMDVGDSVDQTVTTGSGVPINASLDLDLVSWVLHGGVGYDLMQSDGGSLAVVGGVRYMTIDVDVKAGFGGAGIEQSGSDALLDGIVGVSGSINFNKNWYLPYHADIGTGGSDLSYQLFAAIGYRFGWGDVRLGYRHLSFELDDDVVMEDMELSGPVLGVGFTF